MNRKQRGAAALEFALVLPILLVLVLGIVEFGTLLFLSASAAGAAREGAREMAIQEDSAAAIAASESAFPAGTPTVTIFDECATADRYRVTVTYNYTLTGFFAPSFDASGTGEMRCGG